MQLLLAMFVGMVCTWGYKRRNACEGLKLWRLLAGALCGVMLHADMLFYIGGVSFYEGHVYGVTWSLLFAPLFSLLIAYGVGFFAKVPWTRFYAATLGTYVTLIVLSLFTSAPVRPFAPLLSSSVSLHVLDPFDITLFCLAAITLVLGYILNRWRRDIARIGMVFMVLYVIVVATFYAKASSFAGRYVAAFGLETEQVYVLPQPMSPFNWRLIVATEDGRLHDTLINLFRQDEKEVTPTSTRAARIDALYKPMDKAVWRIYRRFGKNDSRFAQHVWKMLSQQSAQFDELSRFIVFKDEFIERDDVWEKRCARFHDLRFEGARESEKGAYLLCQEKGKGELAFTLYQGNSKGHFSKLDMMY